MYSCEQQEGLKIAKHFAPDKEELIAKLHDSYVAVQQVSSTMVPVGTLPCHFCLIPLQSYLFHAGRRRPQSSMVYSSRTRPVKTRLRGVYGAPLISYEDQQQKKKKATPIRPSIISKLPATGTLSKEIMKEVLRSQEPHPPTSDKQEKPQPTLLTDSSSAKLLSARPHETKKSNGGESKESDSYTEFEDSDRGMSHEASSSSSHFHRHSRKALESPPSGTSDSEGSLRGMNLPRLKMPSSRTRMRPASAQPHGRASRSGGEHRRAEHPRRRHVRSPQRPESARTYGGKHVSYRDDYGDSYEGGGPRYSPRSPDLPTLPNVVVAYDVYGNRIIVPTEEVQEALRRKQQQQPVAVPPPPSSPPPAAPNGSAPADTPSPAVATSPGHVVPLPPTDPQPAPPALQQASSTTSPPPPPTTTPSPPPVSPPSVEGQETSRVPHSNGGGEGSAKHEAMATEEATKEEATKEEEAEEALEEDPAVKAWLDNNGLSRFWGRFRAEGMDASALHQLAAMAAAAERGSSQAAADLTAALNALGLKRIGDVLKLRRALLVLATGTQAPEPRHDRHSLLHSHRREAAAVNIQRLYRGHKARRRVKQMPVASDRETEAAAVHLQRMARGRRARKEAEGLRLKKQEEESAVQLQRLARGRVARREAAKRRKAAEEHNSAVRLQRIARGRKARREAQALKRQKEEEERSAMQLQKLARGRNARKKAQQLKEKKQQEKSALTVQRLYRGHSVRRRIDRPRGGGEGGGGNEPAGASGMHAERVRIIRTISNNIVEGALARATARLVVAPPPTYAQRVHEVAQETAANAVLTGLEKALRRRLLEASRVVAAVDTLPLPVWATPDASTAKVEISHGPAMSRVAVQVACAEGQGRFRVPQQLLAAWLEHNGLTKASPEAVANSLMAGLTLTSEMGGPTAGTAPPVALCWNLRALPCGPTDQPMQLIEQHWGSPVSQRTIMIHKLPIIVSIRCPRRTASEGSGEGDAFDVHLSVFNPTNRTMFSTLVPGLVLKSAAYLGASVDKDSPATLATRFIEEPFEHCIEPGRGFNDRPGKTGIGINVPISLPLYR